MFKVVRKEHDFEEIDQIIRFTPESDVFQKNSYWGINNDMVVLSNAPTGSGKTRIIYYACAHYLTKGSVAVTVPIKALSNQKYQEFITELMPMIEEQTGKSYSVGIMTGDAIINPEADLIVMTTEILNESLNYFGDKEGDKKTHLKSTFIERLQCVVFDEAHYINDEDRGHVWESILIKLPQSVNTVLLSATFPNVDYIAKWLSEVRKRDVCLVIKKDRIVPLSHFVFDDNRIVKIMDSNNCFDQTAYESVAHKKIYDTGDLVLNRSVKYLKDNNLLQAIFFVFSKANCEKFAQQITISLVDHTERAEIEKVYNSKMHSHEKDYSNTPQFILAKKLLEKGICFHHAEVIPVLKEIIEILFSMGLIKILFVTETFSVGLNMPTRTVVFTSLIKPTKKEKRLLLPHEYNQMSGRAGRRGKDDFGYVIHIPYYEHLHSSEIRSVLCGNLINIKSKLKIDYNLILKIYSTGSDINSFMSSSLFAKELSNEIEYIEKDLVDNKPDINLDRVKEYDEYIKMLEYEKSLGVAIKMSKNQRKKYKKLEDDKDFKNYSAKKEIIDEYKRKEEYLKYLKEDIPQRIDLVKTVLNKMGFMKGDEVKVNGTIAAQINECNPLVLSSVLMYDADINDKDSDECMLYGLTAEEIVALLSVFIVDQNRDELSLEDVKCSSRIKDRIRKIKNLISFYQNIEKDYIDNEEYWTIAYNNIEAVYHWANGGSFIECLNLLHGPVGGGSFIKHTIKINNIVNDLIALCKVCMNTKLLSELYKIEKLILRDQVTVKSLYID